MTEFIDFDSLGKRLSDVRAQKGLTREKAAGILKIAPQALENYELNRISPNTKILTKMAILYDVSADYLLGLRGIKERPEFVDITEIKHNVIRPLTNRCAALTNCQTCLACGVEIREYCFHYKKVEQALRERENG